ncbi:MAG: DUF4157 domain-containing protein [Thaumarchaeota archaeon]|nr:DUF4157 domain-containing protein [Nitrososphaerota archaeon]
MSVSRASQKQEKAAEGPVGASATLATADLGPNQAIPGVSPSGHALGQTFGIRDPKSRLPRIQTKLMISQPGDFQEDEADRIAERVLREVDSGGATASEPDPPGPRSTSSATLQRNCDGCEESAPCVDCEEESQKTKSEPHSAQTGGIQRTSQEGEGAPGRDPSVTPEFEGSISSLEGRGQPLPDRVRSTFESSFGRDFRGVRIHRDAAANESSRAVGALAYTLGRNIVFAQGQFAPDTEAGKRLLAHELVHVLQQSSTTLGTPRAGEREVGNPERELTTAAGFRTPLSGPSGDQLSRRTSKVSSFTTLIQRDPAPSGTVPADDAKIDARTKKALAGENNDACKAAGDLEFERNSDKNKCGDENLAYAEHYMNARCLVQSGIPSLAVSALVYLYSGTKLMKQGLGVNWHMSEVCESVRPSAAEIKWGLKGVADGKAALAKKSSP